MPHIEIQTPQGKQVMPLGNKAITIGRHPDNVLVLTDVMASRFHCIVEPVTEGYRLRDLGSKNGTKLNGKVVRGAIMVNGDVVTIGQVRLRLVVPAPAKSAIDEVGPDDLVEEITEEDLIEEVTEADLIEDENSPAMEESDVIAVDQPPRSIIGEQRRLVRQMADSLPDKQFEESDITLVNARGEVTHAAEVGEENGEDGRQTVSMLRLFLLICFRSHASDIHIEPRRADHQVRIRVDGSMVEVVRLSKEVGTRLMSLVKIMGEIDIAQRNIVQEGHFSVQVPGRRVDYRLSFAPSMFGQKLVIRIFDVASAPLRVKDLQLTDWMQADLEEAIQRDSGMVLVCGPTGSGKTTSLYAMLRSIDFEQRNVVTIEDPVEIQLDGITQMPVNEAQGSTFPALLRSVLRQDPDVILVGEIRDPETARTAMQAAVTGHMVFTTVHSRDAVGTIFRLMDLGVEPYMIAQGLHRVLAQRLVRLLCPYCKKPSQPTPAQLKRMGTYGEGAGKFFAAVGCPRCLGTGYAGRRAIYELLVTNEALREVILKKPTSNDVYNAISAGNGFERLIHSGYQLVTKGVTSLDEIEHTVGDRAATT